jgi:hypothetical protein
MRAPPIGAGLNPIRLMRDQFFLKIKAGAGFTNAYSAYSASLHVRS